MKKYFISTEKKLLQQNKDKITTYLNQCFWSKNIPLEYVDRFINFSLCFGVYENLDNRLIGFGRIISDYTTYAYICDIIIDTAHRRKGLGNMLIKTMMSHPEVQGLRTWSLRTTEDARKIYEKNGFKLASNPETQLEINDLEIYLHPQFRNLYKKSNNSESVSN